MIYKQCQLKSKGIRLLFYAITIALCLLLCGCSDNNYKGKTYILAYQQIDGEPQEILRNDYIKFTSGKYKAELHLGFTTYYIGKMTMKDGQTEFYVAKYVTEGGVSQDINSFAEAQKSFCGRLNDDTLIIIHDPKATSLSTAFNHSDYVFIEENKLHEIHQEQPPASDDSTLKTGLVGEWESLNGEHYLFLDNWTGEHWFGSDGHHIPFMWDAEDRTLTVSFCKYLDPAFSKEYDFEEAWDGFFLHLYDYKAQSDDEVTLSRTYKRIA